MADTTIEERLAVYDKFEAEVREMIRRGDETLARGVDLSGDPGREAEVLELMRVAVAKARAVLPMIEAGRAATRSAGSNPFLLRRSDKRHAELLAMWAEVDAAYEKLRPLA